MASINYEDIFEQFLGEVTDHNLSALCDSDADELMVGWLHKAIGNHKIRKCFSSFSYSDEVQEITYELKHTLDEESDKDFVTELLAKQMAYHWVEGRVKKDDVLSNFFSGKEVRFFSPAQFITAMQQMKTDSMNDVNRMLGERSISVNGYLGGS